MHEVLVNRLRGLSLLRKSVVRLTDLLDMTLDVYRGRKTTTQQQQQFTHSLTYSLKTCSFTHLFTHLFAFLLYAHLLVLSLLPPPLNFFSLTHWLSFPLIHSLAQSLASYLPLYSLTGPFTCLLPLSLSHSSLHSLARSHTCSPACLFLASIPH